MNGQMTVRVTVPVNEVPIGTIAQLNTRGLAEYRYTRTVDPLEIIGRILEYADKHNLYVDFYPGCVEPGYDDMPILAANWNGPGEYERNQDAKFDSHMVKDKQRMEKLGKLVERLEDKGIVRLEWSDEWAGCSECGKAVRTSPDGWDYKPSYTIGDGELLCHECQPDGEEN